MCIEKYLAIASTPSPRHLLARPTEEQRFAYQDLGLLALPL
jgi:hypothetical protein